MSLGNVCVLFLMNLKSLNSYYVESLQIIIYLVYFNADLPQSILENNACSTILIHQIPRTSLVLHLRSSDQLESFGYDKECISMVVMMKIVFMY